MLAIVAPGQGAQAPGLLAPWLELPGVAARLRWWSEAAGLDLAAAGTTADADEIRDTAVAQPLIVAAGLLAAAELDLLPAGTSGAAFPASGRVVTSGHSVGELTSAAVAGALSPEVALLLVRVRGNAMAEAAGRTPTGMTALLGGDEDVVVAHLDSLGLVAANRNAAGQIVAAGPLDALARLAADPPPGARLRALKVAGAFHTAYMQPAVDALAAIAPGVRPHDPVVPLVSNADGEVVASGGELLRRLVAQVAAPVRWDRCIATFRDLGVTAVLELPPAGTLAGILRRELKGTEIVTVKSPADLPAARALIEAHAVAAARPAAHAESAR